MVLVTKISLRPIPQGTLRRWSVSSMSTCGRLPNNRVNLTALRAARHPGCSATTANRGRRASVSRWTLRLLARYARSQPSPSGERFESCGDYVGDMVKVDGENARV